MVCFLSLGCCRSKNRSVTSLRLRGNDLTARGAAALAVALPRSSLQILDVLQNAVRSFVYASNSAMCLPAHACAL